MLPVTLLPGDSVSSRRVVAEARATRFATASRPATTAPTVTALGRSPGRSGLSAARAASSLRARERA